MFGLCTIEGDLTGLFMFFAGDLARIGIRAAFHLRWASQTGMLQSLIRGDAFASGTAIEVRITSPQLLQGLTLWADILVVLGVPFEVGPTP